jgi:hypothetical protein
VTDRLPRRRFLHGVLATTAALAVARTARAAELPHLDEADATASALGYRHDTTAVDRTRFPSHQPTQVCAGCALAQAPQADGWVPCTIFPGKSVNPKGWCAAFAPKA